MPGEGVRGYRGGGILEFSGGEDEERNGIFLWNKCCPEKDK